jgi:O-antigen/teichoic acid export membrane protein
VNFPELGILVFYFLLSLLIKANFFPKLKYNKSVVEYFMNELGPLYFTGIISGSVVFVLTLIADSQEDATGVTALIAIGFQIITILQFLPMALNRVLFITIASGERIKSKLAIMRLLVFTIIVAIPFYITIPFLGLNYAKLSGFTYVLLVLSSIASTYSTFFGNILVSKGKTKQWTLITFIGTIIGMAVIFFPSHMKLVDLVFITATFIYSIQFILGIIYNEKYRLLHI